MSSIHSFSTASDADDISLTWTIDEIRWLHASEAMADSLTKELEIASVADAHGGSDALSSNSNAFLGATRSATRLTPYASTSSALPSTFKSAGKSFLTASTVDTSLGPRSTPPSSYAYKPSTSVSASDMPASTASFPHSLRVRTPTSPLRRTGTWERHRHYHLERDVDVSAESCLPDLDPGLSSPSVRPLSSSVSEPTIPTRSPSLKLRKLSSTSSSTRIPISASTGSSPTIPIRTRANTREPITSSVPPQLSLSLPDPSPMSQRKEWIYRHPKPRAAPSLSLTTTAAVSTSNNSKHPSPKSSSPRTSLSPRSATHPSRLPVPVRVRTRSISTSSTSPSSAGVKSMYVRPRHGSVVAKQRHRPQTGYLAPAKLYLASNAGDVKTNTAHGYVHSTIPVHARNNKKEKEKEKDRPFWALLRPVKNNGSEERGSSEDTEESSPGSRILKIVNNATTASSLSFSKASEAENADGDGRKGGDRAQQKKSKSKAKGIALVIGRSRPALQQAQEHGASLSSSISSTSTIDDSDTVSSGSTATPLKASASTTTVTASGIQSSSTTSTSPRNRASSSSSESSASSAQTTSTAATSPSPSVSASPKPLPTPTKSILTRSSSTSSRAPPPSGLAAFFGRASTGSGSGSSSMKSVTFVEEPTVHYPYDVDAHFFREEAGESEHGRDDPQFASESDSHRRKEPGVRTKNAAEKEISVDIAVEDDLGSIAGLSKSALAWEMGVDLDTMDLCNDVSSDCGDSSLGANSMDLDTELLFDIGQSYTPRERESIGGIQEEDEDELAEDRDQMEDGADSDDRAKQGKVKKGKGLKRFLNMAGNGVSRTYSKGSSKKTESDPIPIRPPISGPFALGSLPPPAPSSSFQSRSLPSSTIHVHSAAGRSQPHLHGGLSRSRSNSSTTSHISTRHPRITSGISTPVHLKCHSYSHPPRARHFHDDLKTTSNSQDPSLHHIPSTESFRSIAGRSVRSLGSVRSTASTSGFRAWLARVGEGKA